MSEQTTKNTLYFWKIIQDWWEQFNGVTSFIDGSTIYGANQEVSMRIRGGEERRTDGKLLTNTQLKNFLPTRRECGKQFTKNYPLQKMFESQLFKQITGRMWTRYKWSPQIIEQSAIFRVWLFILVLSSLHR